LFGIIRILQQQQQKKRKKKEYYNQNAHEEKTAINAKRYLSPSNLGFEPRFLDGWGNVLLHLPHNLNEGIVL
jgi:hypothetical protein